MNRFVIISGCSGGGKSTLLDELNRRGHAVVEEPGRRIVLEEIKGNGTALPWVDMNAFLHRVIELALADRALAGAMEGWVFFDRGLNDAASGLQQLTGKSVLAPRGRTHRYHRRVFLAPPWPEIYETDSERRHDLDLAIGEYTRLQDAYPSLGYEVFILPKVSVKERADFILHTLQQCP